MIEIILRGSVFGRVAAYMQKCYRHSLLAAICSAFALAYENSRTRQIAESVLTRPPAVEHSLYMRMLSALNNSLHNIGTRFECVWKHSLLCRIYMAVFQNNYIKHSLIYKFCVAVGYRRMLLSIFGFQLVIDYTFRSVQSFAFAASIWDEALMLLCIAIIIMERVVSKNRLEPSPTSLDVPVWFFMALSVALCFAVSPDMRIAIDGLRTVVQFMFWFFIVTRLVRDNNDWIWIIMPLLAITIGVSLHGIYQFVIGVPIPAAWVSQSEMGVRTRVFSIFGSPNIMGSFLVMTAPICAAMAYIWKRWELKALAWVAVGLSCIACLMTFSRGAWLGMAVAILIFALFVDRRLLIAALAAVGIAVFIPQVSDRITYLFTDDFAKRTQIGGRELRWSSGMTLLRTANQFLGFGLGRFGGAVAMQNQVMQHFQYFYMDNYYLKTLVEMGYAGLFGYIFLLLAAVTSSLRKIFALRKTKLQILSIGIFSGMLGVLVHCYYENIFEVPYMNAYFWGLAAVLLTLNIKKAKPTINS